MKSKIIKLNKVVITIYGETRLKDEEIEFVLKRILAKISKIEIKRDEN